MYRSAGVEELRHSPYNSFIVAYIATEKKLLPKRISKEPEQAFNFPKWNTTSKHRRRHPVSLVRREHALTLQQRVKQNKKPTDD